MKDFKLTKEFVRLNNIITDSVLKAFRWDTTEKPLSRYDLGDLLHHLEDYDIFGFYKYTAITPGEDSEYSLIGELLGLSRGAADLQPTYDEWMTIIQKLRLPDQSFYETYQRAFDHRDKSVKGLSGFWRMANEVKDKCAELGCAIERVKEEYQLYDRIYLGDITKPRKRFSGELGRGYEKEPDSYQSELIEKWVMQGADRATVEAAFQPVNNSKGSTPKKEEDMKEVYREFSYCLVEENISQNQVMDIFQEICAQKDTAALRRAINRHLRKGRGNLKKIAEIIFPYTVFVDDCHNDFTTFYNRLKASQ